MTIADNAYRLAVILEVDILATFYEMGSCYNCLKPQDSFGTFVQNFLDLQKVDHTIRKHIKPTGNCLNDML